MQVRKNSAWNSITTASAFVNGAWRTLTFGKAYISGAWRTVATFVQPLSVSAPSAGGLDPGALTITTASTTATPSGGLGPFTYSWTLVSQTNVSGAVADSPSSATTTFTATLPRSNESGSAIFLVTCTDSLGSTASAEVTAKFSSLSGGTQ